MMYPNVGAIITEAMAAVNAVPVAQGGGILGAVMARQYWVNICSAATLPGVTYFHTKIWNDDAKLRPMVILYKATQVINPAYINRRIAGAAIGYDQLALRAEMQPLIDAAVLTQADVDGAAQEFVDYTLAIQHWEAPPDICAFKELRLKIEAFWTTTNSDRALPAWCAIVAKLSLLQPSSAAAERVFSILKRVYGPGQTRALNDGIELSVMLQFNRR
jgi:hypothetical protein